MGKENFIWDINLARMFNCVWQSGNENVGLLFAFFVVMDKPDRCH